MYQAFRTLAGGRHAAGPTPTLERMQIRESLAHGWVSISLPGTCDADPGTYTLYPADDLPPLPDEVRDDGGLDWLRALAPAGTGMAANMWSFTTTPLTAEGVASLLPDGVTLADLPSDLRTFVSNPGLHQRLWSATDAYVDAGEYLEPVPGGHLLHLVSDSQWVLHWFAFLGDDGATGVVCSAEPFGYTDDDPDAAAARDLSEAVWVADSVAEFVWRWWADNYVFAAAHPDLSPTLTSPDWFDATAYIKGYGATDQARPEVQGGVEGPGQ